MFEEYKYKTELHAHTKPGSVCSHISPEYLVKVYKEAGYSTVALTNHFLIEEDNTKEKFMDRYINDYHQTKELGEKKGLNIVLGAELRFTEHLNDYLMYGIEEEELSEIYELLTHGIDNFYKTYKNDKNVIFQAHPFRDNMKPVDVNSIDGVEVFNLHPGHNSRIGFAAKYAREHDLLITAGSDYHHFGHEAMCSIMTKELIETSVQLASILKSRDFIIDISGFKVLPI